jgi:hypothetical protein
MRAVWSFWSRPFQAQQARWSAPLHHLLAWGLSLATARRHFPETVLVTDREGKKLLVDTLGLQFGTVSTELDRLAGADSDWWALGKLVAYSMQDRPFLHIDTDVFLWKPLPQELVDAPVIAQCPEYHRITDRVSRDIERAFSDCGEQLPVEWEWAASREDTFIREENCGIVGGGQVEFLRHYGRTAADLILNPRYAKVWSRLHSRCNMSMEQFFLAACVDFHRHHPDSPFRGVRVKYLFPSWDAAYNPNYSAKAGFTHLLGDAKSKPAVGKRLEERLKRDDPAYFRQCERIAGRMS